MRCWSKSRIRACVGGITVAVLNVQDAIEPERLCDVVLDVSAAEALELAKYLLIDH